MSEAALQLDAFKEFEAFSALSDDDLLVLSERTSVEQVRKRAVLFGEGDEDPFIFCLLEGSLQLTATDGKAHRIDAGTRSARQPLARLKPRKYTAKALTPVRILRIDGSDLGDWQSYLFSHHGGCHAGVSVQEMDDTELLELDELPGLSLERAASVSDGPESGDGESIHYELPSLPTVALEASRIADADDTGIDVLSQLVVNDPPIAAKLIKAANSPVFHGRDAIGTCHRAIVRLGLKTTRQLVMAFAMRDLFKCKRSRVQKAMERLWAHSVEVAAIAFALARRLKCFDPGEAQLAGLLHDIGVVSVLTGAAGDYEDDSDLSGLWQKAQQARSETGALILEAWNFPPAQVLAVRDAEQWWRDDQSEPELADLVVVAQLMSFIGKPGFIDLPPLPRLPAFRKLFKAQASPELVLELLEESEEQVQEIRALLNS